jgi:uncharacterized membrane protein YkvA (DUF1232 family)
MSNPSGAQTTTIALEPTRSRSGLLPKLPLVGDLWALGRFFRDSQASLLGKAFVVASVAYIVWPADAIPDVMPVLGWLDDLGVAALALGYVSRVLRRYR